MAFRKVQRLKKTGTCYLSLTVQEIERKLFIYGTIGM